MSQQPRSSCVRQTYGFIKSHQRQFPVEVPCGLRALHGFRTRRWTVGKPATLIPNHLKRQFNSAIRTWRG